MAYADAHSTVFPITVAFHRASDAVEKYLRYRRTYAALKAAPLDVILDLDMDAGNLKSVARDAVYK
ncbi:hypothetical protein [Algicella marina]|uniref:Uncharacterized protein n=1 Tax=Algicella marina TaxID=2683284 RepID=A0A6P1T2J3_9RHOB|nr:hypothetical protein [Algicella marina]QHQ35883.1 hypothetical protein GO499_12215 [Algicella marina]